MKTTGKTCPGLGEVKVVELKGLSRYRFKVGSSGLVVESKSNGVLKGSERRGWRLKTFHLRGDDGRYRNYRTETLMFYVNNPELPALCTDLCHRGGVHLSADGKLISDFHPSRRFDVFRDINDALETVLLIKAYQEGDMVPVMMWVNRSRAAAVRVITKYRREGYEIVENCLAGGEARFYSQLRDMNVKRIMPLFAMLCKCIKQEILDSLQFARR